MVKTDCKQPVERVNGCQIDLSFGFEHHLIRGQGKDDVEGWLSAPGDVVDGFGKDKKRSREKHEVSDKMGYLNE